MQLDQLQHHEQLVLLGLFHWVMHADGVVTDEEAASLEALRQRLGPAAWDARLAESKEAFPTVEALVAGCREVTRPAARQSIYGELVGLATADELDAAEAELLNWLAVHWGFVSRDEVERVQAEAAAATDPDQADATDDEDSFDLFG